MDVHYLDSVEDRDRGLQRQVSQLVDEIEAERYGPRGDVLVFCPGERQIRDLAKELRGRERIQVLPLYARLSNAEQNRVFNRTGAGMRVVLATNVAETSLTVPGIRYVIDPGMPALVDTVTALVFSVYRLNLSHRRVLTSGRAVAVG